MKLAHIVPIHKSNNKHDTSNYRPIALLSPLSKVLEKIIHTRIYNFLTSSNLISDFQFGFLPERNTTNAISLFLGSLIKNIENEEFSISLFIDFSKAFDTIDHSILLHKLKDSGVGATPAKLTR